MLQPQSLLLQKVKFVEKVILILEITLKEQKELILLSLGLIVIILLQEGLIHPLALECLHSQMVVWQMYLL